MPHADTVLHHFDSCGQHELAGMLGRHLGEKIMGITGSYRRAGGYLNMAAQSFVQSGSTGFAQHLVRKYPTICSPVIQSPSILEAFLGRSGSPDDPLDQEQEKDAIAVQTAAVNLDAIT